MSNCLFCQIVNKQLPSYQILESPHCVAILDVFPVAVGHSLVITKEHYPNLQATPAVVLEDAIVLVQKVANLLSAKLANIQGFNYLSNQNAIALQTVFHTHWHIMPKYVSDQGFSFSETRPQNALDLSQLHQQLVKK